MLIYEKGSEGAELSSADLTDAVGQVLASVGSTTRMLIVPPDITRLHSRAGEVTELLYRKSPSVVAGIMPALGTHRPMDASELSTMFGSVPHGLFMEHRWRTDCTRCGELSGDEVRELSGGIVDFEIPVLFNDALLDKRFDCIVSVSQVVPHEVAGMAGYTKNLFVGLGGSENIHKSHFLGAAYGMERIMGKAATPVRTVFNAACERFLAGRPVIHIITVLGTNAAGTLVLRGIYAGTGIDCYEKASDLSRRINVHILDKPIKKAVVYLDPVEYKSAWLGNKSIYRTRMAIADGGELIVLAPGVGTFGEDEEIDRLIRRFGYRGTSFTLDAVAQDPALRSNLSAAAHLIHGSSEGRFSITYAAGKLGRDAVESVGFGYDDIDKLLKRYDPARLPDGECVLPDGEEIFFISKPGSGLWAWNKKF